MRACVYLCICVFVYLCIFRVSVVARLHKGVRVDTKIVLLHVCLYLCVSLYLYLCFLYLCICRVGRVHKGAQWVDSKIVLNWLLASSTATAPTTSVQIGVNFKQTELGEQNKGWPHAVFLKFVQSVFFAT